jgi:hypothetical protein
VKVGLRALAGRKQVGIGGASPSPREVKVGSGALFEPKYDGLEHIN